VHRSQPTPTSVVATSQRAHGRTCCHLGSGSDPAGPTDVQTRAATWDDDEEQVTTARDPVPDKRFDLVASVLARQHIRGLGRVPGALAMMLEPGDRRCVGDLEEDQEDGTLHDVEPCDDAHGGSAVPGRTGLRHDAGLPIGAFGRLDPLVKDHRSLADAHRPNGHVATGPRSGRGSTRSLNACERPRTTTLGRSTAPSSRPAVHAAAAVASGAQHDRRVP